MIKRTLAAALVLGLLPAVAHAQSLRNSLSPASFSQRQTMAQWQQEYDLALADKNEGKKKMLVGGAAVVGGFVISMVGMGGDGDVPRSGTVMLGGLVEVAGGVYFIWGVVEFVGASGDLSRLAIQKPAGRTSAIALTDHQALQWTAGKQRTVSYRISW